MDQIDYDLLTRIEHGGRVFRPGDRSPEARAAFQVVVERLLHLRDVGLIRLPQGRIMRTEAGAYLIAGPCDLTPAGIVALTKDRSLGPRAAPKETE